MSKEIWKDVPNYEGIYQVSNHGRVKSLSRLINWRGVKKPTKEKILSQSKNSEGYVCHVLHKDKSKKHVKAHSLEFEVFNGKYDKTKFEIDHIDNDRGNNKLSNLRLVTRAQNCMNRALYKNKSSKYKGVHLRKDTGKYRAIIRVNQKNINIGQFDTEIEAAKAYNKKAGDIFGEYAHINRL